METALSYLLLQAFYAWPEQLDLTACIWVNTEAPHVQVPESHVYDGKIQLNIARKAIRNLQVNTQKVQFEASFSGDVSLISIPISAILAIYISGNGQKLLLTSEEGLHPNIAPQIKKDAQKKPSLTLVE